MSSAHVILVLGLVLVTVVLVLTGAAPTVAVGLVGAVTAIAVTACRVVTGTAVPRWLQPAGLPYPLAGGSAWPVTGIGDGQA